MFHMALSYIGLGSNQAQPKTQIQTALNAIDQIEKTQILRCSSLYCSEPVGYIKQAPFINAVAEIQTSLPPDVLLNRLQYIEAQQGRIRNQAWSARSIDLDILTYDHLIIDQTKLTLPHPQIIYRAFVIYPLLELNPQIHLPKWGKIKNWTALCAEQRIQRCPEFKPYNK